MKGRLITAGDVIQQRGAGGSDRDKQFWRIMFFIKEFLTGQPKEAVCERMEVVERRGEEGKLKVGTPRQFKIIEMQTNTTFIAASPDCIGMGCSYDSGRRVVVHKEVQGKRLVTLLTKKRAFPPRQG